MVHVPRAYFLETMLNEHNTDVSKSYGEQCVQEYDYHAGIAQTQHQSKVLLLQYPEVIAVGVIAARGQVVRKKS